MDPTDEEVKLELEKLERKEIEGNEIRSRAEWIEKGEKSTKYFYDLERERGQSKQVTEIRDSGGVIHRDREHVCGVVRDLYERLYTAEPTDEVEVDRIIGEIVNSLTDEESDRLSTPLTEGEYSQALKGMNKNKSPGLDSLTKEFYIQLWDVVGGDLTETLNNAHMKSKMPKSMTEGLITLIYKEKGEVCDFGYQSPSCPLTKILVRLLQIDLNL